MSDTPLTDAALKRTQGMFRAASAANGFTDHARLMERERDALIAELERICVEIQGYFNSEKAVKNALLESIKERNRER